MTDERYNVVHREPNGIWTYATYRNREFFEELRDKGELRAPVVPEGIGVSVKKARKMCKKRLKELI